MTCQMTKAAEKADIDRGTHYDWLKDPEYKPIFGAAQFTSGRYMLEDLAVR